MDTNNKQALCIEDHVGLIFLAANRLGIATDDEVLQVGRISLWNAIKGYDESRGYAFATYAVKIITRDIRKIHFGRKEKQLGPIDKSYTHSPISDYLPTLSELDSSIIALFLENCSLIEIAKRLGKSKSFVTRRFNKLKEMIRAANE